MKKVSTKRDPLMRGVTPLGFDNYTLDEVNELTEEQKLDKFMSKYMDVTRPLSKYKKYFESSAMETGHILREVKRFYGLLVLHGKWSEKQYVKVLDRVFRNRAVINSISLDIANRQIEREAENKKRRRRA